MENYELEKIGYRNEAAAWKEMQQIRDSFNPSLLNGIRANSKEEALERSVGIVQRTLSDFGKSYDFSTIEPGHGSGHIMRDYMNSIILFSQLEDVNPKHIVPGFVGGSLHDLGCAITPRYQESGKAVRHAEAGALFVSKLLEKNPDLNEAERLSIAYSVAAHTNYLKESVVECADGEKRTVKPYTDLDRDGNPLWPIFFTRWVDRLDTNGPTFVGRHYMTLAEEHQEFTGSNYYDVNFKHHMDPFIRNPDKQVDEKGNKKETMLEHFKKFADTNNNDSVYGRHDYGFMVQLREEEKKHLYEIIREAQRPIFFSLDGEVGTERERINRESWTRFLYRRIEPSELGRKTAEKLDGMFGELDTPVRSRWLNGFFTTMGVYDLWATERLRMLEPINPSWHRLEPITDDIRKVIDPRVK